MPAQRRQCPLRFDHPGRACDHVEALGRESGLRRLCGGGRGGAHVEGGGGEGEPRAAPTPPQPQPHSPLLSRTSNPSSRPKPLPTQTLPRYHPTPAPTCPHAPNHSNTNPRRTTRRQGGVSSRARRTTRSQPSRTRRCTTARSLRRCGCRWANVCLEMRTCTCARACACVHVHVHLRVLVDLSSPPPAANYTCRCICMYVRMRGVCAFRSSG